MVKVAPSILSADFTNIREDFKFMEKGGADYVHVDVMDGRYVPNITFGPPLIKQWRGLTEIPFDVHLMMVEPDRYLNAFADAGADIITFHRDAVIHTHRMVQRIHDLGLKAGISINPGQGLEDVRYLLGDLDLVLLMSVNPGFGGQSFIPSTLEKIRKLKKMIEEEGHSVLIEVDGGVTEKNVKEIYEAGADIVVAGTAVFKAEDPSAAILRIKEAGI